MRIEDLDPPREMPGAREQIPKTLEQFGFEWDGPVILQSQRLDIYRDYLHTLEAKGSVYRCQCSRKQLQQRSGGNIYDGYCRQHPPADKTAAAYRCICEDRTFNFDDRIQGVQQYYLPKCSGDFVLFRKDGLFAYQMAVVIDDELQQISHVVRGHDLLDETPRQQQLQQHLTFRELQYAHIPVANNIAGQKLSKQNLAEAITPSQASALLWQALSFLGQQPDADLQKESATTLLQWGIKHWNIDAVPKTDAILWQG